MEAVLQAALRTTVDSDLGAVAVLCEVAETLAAAPVLFSSGLDIDGMELAVDLLAGSLNLVFAVVQLEVAAVCREQGAVDLMVSGVELEDLSVNLEMAVMDVVVTVESKAAAVWEVPTVLEVVAVFKSPTVVFEMILTLFSLPLQTVMLVLTFSADSDTLIWVIETSSFDSRGTLVSSEVVSEDGCALESSGSSSISIFTTW